MDLLLITHLLATLYMMGLIWFVQVVHYPLMAYGDSRRFDRFAVEHSRRTSWVVAPPMVIEATTALILAFRSDAPATLSWTGVALLVIIWLSTALLQVPCHRKLGSGFDPAAHRRLVRTNWMRTAAWTVRAVLAAAMVARGL